MTHKYRLLYLCILLPFYTHAQTVLYYPKSLSNYINSPKWITVIDRVNDIKLKPGTDTTLLFIGGYFSNQALTVIVKNIDQKFKAYSLNQWLNKDVLINGNVIQYEGKPAIIIKDSSQVNVTRKVKTNY